MAAIQNDQKKPVGWVRTYLHLVDLVVVALIAAGALYVRNTYPLTDWACQQAGETITDFHRVRGLCVHFDPDNVQNHLVGKAFFWGAFVVFMLVSWTIFLKYTATMWFAGIQMGWPKVRATKRKFIFYFGLPLLGLSALFVFYELIFKNDQFVFDFFYGSGPAKISGGLFLVMNYFLMAVWGYLRRDYYLAHGDTKTWLAWLQEKRAKRG